MNGIESSGATSLPNGSSHRRARVALKIVAFFVVLVVAVAVSVTAVYGRDKTWNWVESQWRLDVGAPSTTEPYPASIGEPLVRLAAAGDVGTGGTAEKRTAEVMDSLEVGGEFAALLLLGDNVYPSGDASRLQSNVFDPFAAVLDGPTELVAALGNHDVQTDAGQPQIDALGLPGRWYTKTYGPVKVVVVDSTRASDPDQLDWLQAELSVPTDATWTVVIQHHPPFSAGYHGSHESSRLHLVTLYEAAGVDLVLSGHDHDYQQIKPQNGVTYVVSGAAAKLRKTGRAGFTVEAASTYSFLEMDAYVDELVVRSVDHDGRIIDTFSLPAR